MTRGKGFLMFACVSILFGACAVRAEDPVAPLTFCSFGPKIKVFESAPAKKDSKSKVTCAASLKVQGMQWECAPMLENGDRVTAFRRSLIAAASEECAKFCEKRGSGCTGKFDSFIKAGRETDSEEAAAAGRKLGCRKECAGQALVFASIYDANYLMGDAGMLADETPNCHCFSSK